jgi:hypothetical protein
MKKLFLGLVVAGLLSGCSHRYVVTLNNNMRLTATTKPRLKGGNYYFKDAQGKETYVPSGRVKEIAPASMANEEKKPFKPEAR